MNRWMLACLVLFGWEGVSARLIYWQFRHIAALKEALRLERTIGDETKENADG